MTRGLLYGALFGFAVGAVGWWSSWSPDAPWQSILEILCMPGLKFHQLVGASPMGPQWMVLGTTIFYGIVGLGSAWFLRLGRAKFRKRRKRASNLC